MLLAIKHYLVERKTANLQELAAHFHQSPEVMRDMMAHWIRKGKVTCFKPAGCGTRCQQCLPKFAETYLWV